jgi:hypothetical protein
MLRPKTAFGRIVGSVLLAAAVVALANLSNPSLVASTTYSLCNPGANPCETCPSTGGSYQCLPPVANYNWGSCTGSSSKRCYEMSFYCVDLQLSNCNTPPGPAGLPCMKITPTRFQCCRGQ